ncbi:N-acetylmuramoyl-L-alanine amidase [Enterococcus sp. BWB1-3]|uniref:N-acetylmuramoyl-L-alanine amidase n=1 Tax=Enterococcus sp. BWB1-3 TaxID=2787713 RepID=UPI001F3BC3BF|nr:N-acetylmuramoyl-L-alanine amidase [Enterococcus sp. BWB1-3]
MKKKYLNTLFLLVVLLSVSSAFYYLRLQSPIIKSSAASQETAFEVTQTQLAAAKTSANQTMITAVQMGPEDSPLYSQPDSSSEEIALVTRGEYMEYLDTENGWYHVIVNNEYEGYVSSLYSEKYSINMPVTPTSPEGAVVVLNPGHGGEDTGALSNDEYYYEKDVTLSTAQVIQETLETAGFTVILTRDSDITESLDDICADSIDNHADFFISLHYDSTEYMNDASGTTTYYYYNTYKELAETVNDALASTLPLENRGVEVGNYQVLRENTRPSLLLELGYMNNDYDQWTFMTESYQQQVADALLEALTEYIQAA